MTAPLQGHINPYKDRNRITPVANAHHTSGYSRWEERESKKSSWKETKSSEPPLSCQRGSHCVARVLGICQPCSSRARVVEAAAWWWSRMRETRRTIWLHQTNKEKQAQCTLHLMPYLISIFYSISFQPIKQEFLREAGILSFCGKWGFSPPLNQKGREKLSKNRKICQRGLSPPNAIQR